jgi:hydroxyacylglutathione hydrolase
MLFERYYDESLAQASYLIGCERTREAIIIDPNRDIERYVRAAAALRFRVKFVTETHIHADFLSGSRDLAAATGAALLLSGHGGSDWSYRFGTPELRLLRDGESITLGTVRLDVMHTPGHTPEHICFLVTDTATGDQPIGMVSGDFLFVGDVGRPDLLERAAKVAGSMEHAARELYASQQRVSKLPDYLQIWPGHGAGSACGKSLGAMPQSTLGYERLFNPGLQHKSEEAFVRWVLADQPEPPAYFAVMKRLNRDGPPQRVPATEIPRLYPARLLSAIEEGALLVDLRPSPEFASAHMGGATNIPMSKSFATYAGTILDYERPIVLLAKSEQQAHHAVHQLSLIGFDRISGWVLPDVLSRLGDTIVSAVRSIDAPALSEALEGDGRRVRVIDVRNRSEWKAGHLPGATHIFLGELEARLDELDRDEPIVVQCASGTRSSIAASMMLAHGFTNVANLAGGIDAWRKAGFPVQRDD